MLVKKLLILKKGSSETISRSWKSRGPKQEDGADDSYMS